MSVTASNYTDAALNLGGTGSDTVTIDTENPTVTVDIDGKGIGDDDNSSVTFSFQQKYETDYFDAITFTNGAV